MLPRILAEAARRHGDRTAFQVPSGAVLSYRELDRASDEVAAGVAARGLSAGEVLLLSLPSGLEYVVSYLAATKVGAVTAGANPRLRARERRLVVDAVGPHLVLATDELADGLPDDAPVEVVATSGVPGRVLTSLRSTGEGVPPWSRTRTGRCASASLPVPPGIPGGPGSQIGNWRPSLT
ncbi:MAG: hypothetical protein Ct9H300mP31_20580 [Acidimicrobiaceae bacterium]|nr:MAG: hypothetical protein Ct9H300mP31_20580 [Acidimicrobiaceae bacterium]